MRAFGSQVTTGDLLTTSCVLDACSGSVSISCFRVALHNKTSHVAYLIVTKRRGKDCDIRHTRFVLEPRLDLRLHSHIQAPQATATELCCAVT